MAAARKGSQVITHMAIGFAIAYAITGSVALSGLATLIEPILNVLAAPLHEKAWERLHHRAGARRRYLVLAGEKLSLTAMHTGVAFTTFFLATGSAASGGLVVIVEAACNAFLMPLHDRLWENALPGQAAA